MIMIGVGVEKRKRECHRRRGGRADFDGRSTQEVGERWLAPRLSAPAQAISLSSEGPVGDSLSGPEAWPREFKIVYMRHGVQEEIYRNII